MSHGSGPPPGLGAGAGCGRGTRPVRRLYGREADTAALASALDAVHRGGSRLVALDGAAGVGKSALLAGVRTDVRRRGWTVVPAGAAFLETANDFGVLRQVLSGLPAPPDGRPAPALTETAASDTARFALFEEVTAHLLEVAAGAPVVITLDDLQWCDPPSLRWLAYLAHRSAGLPLGIVVACSFGEMDERRFLLDELVALFERRTLGPLAPAQLRSWITDALGAHPDDAFVAGCHRATGGNPALLAALLPALAARPAPPVRASLPALEGIGGGAVSRRVLPWILRGGPKAQAVAQAVAILAEDAELVLVAELAGLGLDDAARVVDRLIRMHILSDTAPLRYVQPLVRAAVQAGMPGGLRTSQRLRAALLVRDRRAEPERAAAQLLAADVCGEPWARETLRAAAASALQRGEARESLGYLRRALAEPMPLADRAELLADIGAAEIGAGDGGAGATLRQALDLAAEPTLRVRIGVDLAIVDATAGRPIEAALRVVDEAGAQLPAERRNLVADAEFGVFFAYASSADAAEFYDRRVPRLRELAAGDARLSALAGVADAWTRIRGGCDRAECARRARDALAAIDRNKVWEFGLRLLAVGALINADADEFADDPSLYGDSLYGDSLYGDSLYGDSLYGDGAAPPWPGAARGTAIGTYLHGRVLFGRGALKSARTEIGAALEDPFVARTVGFARLVRVLTELGDLDAAACALREHAPPPSAAPTWTTIAFAYAEGCLHTAHGRYGKALECFLETGRGAHAIGLDNPAVFPWRSRAARCHAALGDAGAGEEPAAAELELARRWGGPRALSTALAAAGLVNGDEEAARESLAVLGSLDADLHRASALVDLGAVQLRRGRGAEAHENLQEGFALAQTIHARPVRLRAARHLRRAGGRPDPSRVSGVAALTAQERAAAERAAAGATNRRIAEEMVLTQRTVEQYLTSAYRKLGVSGRRQLPAALHD